MTRRDLLKALLALPAAFLAAKSRPEPENTGGVILPAPPDPDPIEWIDLQEYGYRVVPPRYAVFWDDWRYTIGSGS